MKNLTAIGLLAAALTSAQAQTLPGLWGSTQYQVQLTVTGTTVTGTFTSLADPQAPAGSLKGTLGREGQAFAADWTVPLGADTGTFHTWLSLRAKGALLEGLRWSDGGQPVSFSLHRAVNGQVPLFPDDDEPKPATPAPSTTPAPPTGNAVELKGPADSAALRLPNGYPRSNLRLELTVNWTAPGTILDTIGMNAAPVGAWSLSVAADGRIALSVYDPGRPSPQRDRSGWHRLVSKPAAARTDHPIRIDHSDTEYVLTVDGESVRMALATPLSGQPVYVGDFPGDAQWPPPVVTKTGMTGRVVMRGLGALPK